MSNIWNLSHPLRSGFVEIAPYGKEFFGTVIRRGHIDKTATVRVSFYSYQRRARGWIGKSRNILVHDVDNYSRVGDKVVI